MLGATRRQLPITGVATVVAFYVRLTWLPGASPYELFLLLNILIAILFKPAAVLTSVGAGLVAAHLLIWLDAGPFFTSRYWTLTIAYLVLSGLLLAFNHLGHRLSARVFREQRLKEAIFASSLHAIVTLDADGRVVAVNAAAVEMFGYSRQEVTGQRLVDLIAPPEFRHILEKALVDERSPDQSNSRNRQLELHVIRKDGTAFSVDFALVKIELPDGVFFITHIRDITERKTHELERERLLSEAQKANQVKDDLLANLSHEFRTPLNAILGWSKMLRRGQVPAERLGHVAEVIERNAQAQAKLVDDLLDSSLASC